MTADDKHSIVQQRALLRQRYSSAPVPRCPYCHNEMERKYQCSQHFDLYRCVEDHSERTRYTGHPDMLAALDAAEAAEQEQERLRTVMEHTLSIAHDYERHDGSWYGNLREVRDVLYDALHPEMTVSNP